MSRPSRIRNGLVVAAVGCLAACGGATSLLPHGIADAQPPPNCPPKICPPHTAPSYTFTPDPTGSESSPGSTGKPKPGPTKKPKPGQTTTAGVPIPGVSGQPTVAPSQQPTNAGVFGFGAEPPQPPLPLEAPPPPPPLSESIPAALLAVAGVLALAGFVGIMRTMRRPTMTNPSPAKG